MSAEEDNNIRSWTGRGGGRPQKPYRALFVPEETQLPPDEQIKTVSQFATEALKLKYWLFDPKFKQWFTPEELIEKHGRIYTGNEAFLKRLEIKDPVEAVKQADEVMEDIRKRSQTFALKVIEYFNSKVR